MAANWSWSAGGGEEVRCVFFKEIKDGVLEVIVIDAEAEPEVTLKLRGWRPASEFVGTMVTDHRKPPGATGRKSATFVSWSKMQRPSVKSTPAPCCFMVPEKYTDAGGLGLRFSLSPVSQRV